MKGTLISFDGLNVKPSYVDIKKGIRLPTEYSEDLAYFCGILAGDGHIQFGKNNYDLVCAGNPLDEQELYTKILSPIVQDLFNIKIKSQHFPDSGTFGFRFSSKLVVLFLVRCLGLPANKKYDQLQIPSWIKQTESFLKAYIRGLADTDFCICLKKRYKKVAYYPVVSGVSKSKSYIEEIALALESFGFKVSRSYDVIEHDSRYKNGFCKAHRIHIYGATQLINWMKVIGFASPKHLNKFELWQFRNQTNRWLKVKDALKAAVLLKN